MTCIVALQRDGIVYMATDSLAWDGYTKGQIHQSKLIKRRNFLLGFSGKIRDLNLIQYKLNPRSQVVGEDLQEYVTDALSEAVRSCIRDGGSLEIDKAQEVMDSYLLVAYQGRLFRLGSDFAIDSYSRGYDAIGNCAEVALGALDQLVLNTELTPKEILTRALETAERLNPWVQKPFAFEEQARDGFTKEKEKSDKEETK